MKKTLLKTHSSTCSLGSTQFCLPSWTQALRSLKTRLSLAARLKSWRSRSSCTFAKSLFLVCTSISIRVSSQIEFTAIFQVFQLIEENSIEPLNVCIREESSQCGAKPEMCQIFIYRNDDSTIHLGRETSILRISSLNIMHKYSDFDSIALFTVNSFPSQFWPTHTQKDKF